VNKNRIILALSGLALGVLAAFAGATAQAVLHDSPWDYSAPAVNAPALLTSQDVQHCLGLPSDSPWD
jgi:hypothetical protein